MDRPEAAGGVFNVGTGRPTSITQVAGLLARVMEKEIAPDIVGKYRSGDIRHCIADISRTRSLLGFEPQVPLENGITEPVEWVIQQEAEDRVEAATRELKEKGLAR